MKKTAAAGQTDADSSPYGNSDALDGVEARLLMEAAAGVMADGILLGGKDRKTVHFMGSHPNKGTLIIDASCCPVNIRYPQDFSLLNEAREKLEAILNRICKEEGQEKPRTYCRKARREYLDSS